MFKGSLEDLPMMLRPICHSADDTLMHLLRDCPRSMQIWRAFPKIEPAAVLMCVCVGLWAGLIIDFCNRKPESVIVKERSLSVILLAGGKYAETVSPAFKPANCIVQMPSIRSRRNSNSPYLGRKDKILSTVDSSAVGHMYSDLVSVVFSDAKHKIQTELKFTLPGKERQDSVYCGLQNVMIAQEISPNQVLISPNQVSYVPGRNISDNVMIAHKRCYSSLKNPKMLSDLIHSAVEYGHWKSVNASQSGPRISHLFFVDDLMLFAEATEHQAYGLKTCLDNFCAISGQIISYEKSLIFCSPNTTKTMASSISATCGSPLTSDLGKYLGMPLIHSRVNKHTYDAIFYKVQSRLSSWKSKVLNMAGRLTLIQSVTSAIPNYAMQTTKFPVSLCDRLDKLNRNFLWGDVDDKKKLSPFGELRHSFLRISICPLLIVLAPGEPSFMELSLSGLEYSSLNDSVPADVNQIINVPTRFANSGRDTLIWGSTANGCFSVKSAYNSLFDFSNSQNSQWKLIWNLDIPPKLKNFLWTMLHKSMQIYADLESFP
ncbi:PREDICTED: uncharacterized protein LOC101313223 [Fragaria vesca subsp. vesca]